MHTLAKIDLAALSEKQRLFVKYSVEGHKQTKAAELAGYGAAGQRAHELMALPHIRAAIWSERERRFCGDLASLATNTLRDLMEDDQTPAHVRFQAAKLTLAIAGHVDKSGKLSNGGEKKQLHEMNAEELDAFISDQRAAITILEADVVTKEDDGDSTAQADDLQPE